MAYKNGYRLWDDEYKQALWTPKEIAESKKRVAQICNIINAEKKGLISHDEAMIRHLMLDPDLLDNILDDAYNDEAQVKRVKAWAREEKARSREASYWASLLKHAERAASNGYNVDYVVNTLNKALHILKETTTTSVSA